MLEATAGLGPDVENKIVVFERRGLARSAGYRLEDWNERGDGFLKIIDELRKILLPHYVVHDDVIFRAEDFEIFFGEIGNFQWAIGEGIVVWRLKCGGRGVLHAGGNAPAAGGCDRKRGCAILSADDVHPNG